MSKEEGYIYLSKRNSLFIVSVVLFAISIAMLLIMSFAWEDLEAITLTTLFYILMSILVAGFVVLLIGNFSYK